MIRKCPKVSVCVVTYNQERYIGQCLDSLVGQETDFEFEIIVADDCSTDETRVIIGNYAKRFPDIVRTVFHDKNLGPFKNYLAVHEIARGEYVAHMDGDDYALPGKLQAQADYLDENKGCAIVWHRMKIFDEKNCKFLDDLIDVNLLPKEGIRQNDLLAIGSVACHSSKMYRLKNKPAEIGEAQFLDFFIDAWQLQFGSGQYLPQTYGVYRANVGISNSGFKTRYILISNLVSLAKKFPSGRRAISAHLLRLTIADIVHRRPTLMQSLKGFVKTFTPLCLIDLLATRHYLKIFRSPL